MDKQKLSQYKPMKRELKMIEKKLDRLYDRRLDIPVVKGKVSASDQAFPYIERHVTVQMDEPKKAEALTKKIKEKENRKEEIRNVIEEIETFIEDMAEGEDKQIFELTYLEGMRQREVAEMIGLEQSSISKRITSYLKLSSHS